MEQSLIPCWLFPRKCAWQEQCPWLRGAGPSQTFHTIGTQLTPPTSDLRKNATLEEFRARHPLCTEPSTGSRERPAVWAFQTFWEWGQESHHLLLLECRDSSFLLMQTGHLDALGFSSPADTAVSPCRQHQDTSQAFPCPRLGMDSTLWSHSRSRPGDNATAQLSLLGCLSLSVPFQLLWSHDQPLEQALSTRKLPNWCPL